MERVIVFRVERDGRDEEEKLSSLLSIKNNEWKTCDMKKLIEFKSVTREYDIGSHILKAVDDASFSIGEGEFVVILGPSGAGKSTDLNLLGGMDTLTSGKIVVSDQDISALSDNDLTQYRVEKVGFVFQFYNLIPTLTALENIALTKDIVKSPIPAMEMLDMVGFPTMQTNSQHNCRAGNSSVYPSPARWPRILSYCFATSLLGHWTAKRG